MLFRKGKEPGTVGRLTIVDHNESYGRHLLKRNLLALVEKDAFHRIVDLGCGSGNDLEILIDMCGRDSTKEYIGVDYRERNKESLLKKNIQSLYFNIEHDNFPFENESVDLFISNQIFEHCKEIFWINHEIFRCLRKGGYLFIGVPNIVSLHNRILSLFGYHPTNWRTLSAHVRTFSKRDCVQFYNYIGNNFLKIKFFGGSQFYPFPGKISRILSGIFPNMAYSIFFLIQKTDDYRQEFLDHPIKTKLETNFYVGKNTV